MLNTLYTIAGGIALAVGALGASDDFDGAQLAQNAFFGPEDEFEAIDEQETTDEVVVAVKDVFEWDEIASKAMEMTLTGSDELTDDEKLEIAVLTGEIPSDDSENLVEDSQIADNSQSEGLSEEEFYSMLEQQFNDAMASLDSDLDSEEEIADSEPLVIEAVQEDLAAVELQPEDDVNAEVALEEAQNNSESTPENVAQVNEISEEGFKELEPWVVIHGLPDIPDEDLNALTGQPTMNEQPEQPEQLDIENIDVQEIPVMESILVDVPDIDAPEIETIDPPLFDEEETEAEDADVEVNDAEETEAEDADVEESDAEETEAEDADVEESDAEETEAEDADVEVNDAEETEAEDADVEESDAEETEAEDADVEESDAEETEAESINAEAAEIIEAEDDKTEETEDDELIVEPLEDSNAEVELNDEALLIPSLEIPPAVVTEEQRAKISEEVDAIANQGDSFDSWIPRQIPVSGSVEDVQPQTKPEDDFIQDFSRKNVKESILENNGIDLK